VTILIEAAVESAAEAVFAARNGADRLEVCDFSVAGGRTPHPDTLRQILAASNLPVHVLIRPRGGGFEYGEAELRVMEQQIDEAKELGAAAVVTGVLRGDGRMDRIALARLIGRARPLELVFHRAIDLTPDPLAALDALLALGVGRVLTAGGRATAVEGAEVIRQMIGHAGRNLTVIAGGGVRARNVKTLIDRSGVSEVHARDIAGIRDLV
jgi:copper homeostasis protein